MMRRNVRTDDDRRLLMSYLANQQVPFNAMIRSGEESRSAQQNRLSHQWYKDAGAQGDMPSEEQRAYCKLHFGVPILRRDDQEFREMYDLVIRPHDYEVKMKIMCGSTDFPVTSRMGVKQMTEYLDLVYRHYRDLGIQLTDPQMLGMTL